MVRGTTVTVACVAALNLAGAQAQAQQLVFKISAGPLSEALKLYSRQSGTELIFRTNDVRRSRSPGAKGTMRPDVALDALLAGTGFVHKKNAYGAIAIVPRPIATTDHSPGVRLASMAVTDVPPAVAEAANAGALEEIVVTAQRRAENLQRVPITVSAATGEALTAAGIASSVDLPRVVPGLVTYQLGSAFLPYIRGVGSIQSGGGNESPIALYIDGIYQGAKSGNVFDLINIERVEVLKGPQGTLFGRNANGGAINIVTKDPGTDSEIDAEAGYGRFDERTVRAYAAGPITDTLGASLSFSGRWSDGYIYNITRKEENPTRNLVAMGKLAWKPTEELTAKLSAAYSVTDDPTSSLAHVIPGQRARAEAFGGTVTYNNRETANDAPGENDARSTRVALELNYSLPGVKIVSLTGYARTEAYSIVDLDASDRSIFFLSNGLPGRQFTQELQLQSTSSGSLSWIIGAHYFQFKEGQDNPPENLVTAFGVSAPFRPADLLAPGVNVTGLTSFSKTKAGAIFGQATYNFTPRTRLTLGLRYTKERKHVQGRTYRYVPLPGSQSANTDLNLGILGNDGLIFTTTPLLNMDLKKSWSRPTWRVAIDHELNPDMLAYASYNRGFKSGSYVTGQVNPAQVPVDPETLDAFEVGLKSELLDRRLRLNVSSFYYRYTDIQISFLTSGGVFTNQNAASARLYGLDLDLLARPLAGLTLRAGANYLNSKYKSFPRAQIALPNVAGVTCPTPAIVLSPDQASAIAGGAPTGGACNYALNANGLRMVYAPKFTGNIGFDYDQPIGGGARLLLNANMSYSTSYDHVPGGFFARTPSYETLNASVTYYGPDDRYFVRAWGNNITDDRHPIIFIGNNFGLFSIDNRPISYGVTVGYKFGAK